MKILRYQLLLWMFALILALTFASHEDHFKKLTEVERENEERESGDAWDAFEWWYGQRAMPYELIPPGAFQRAAEYKKLSMAKDRPRRLPSGATSTWTSMGPTNVGGRVLSLAIDPRNTSIVWAGSASGGLWRSTSGGEGESAWTFVNTGYPSFAISCIVLDPSNPDVMYVGTGEVSLHARGLVGTPGARASYGLGILKSTDAGTSWSQTSLTFTFSQLTAIERIAINPLNTRTLYAATTEGTYKSTNAGGTWSLADSVLMAMDVVLDPVDTTRVYIACGNLNSSPNPGIYVSTNAGSTWTQQTSGLPSTNFGRTCLVIAPSDHTILYAGIANGSTSSIQGLYKTFSQGAGWILMSSVNYVSGQGWYDNVVAVHPHNADSVYCSGLDLYRAVDGGSTLVKLSDWTAGYGGAVSPGGPEGLPSYTHADHHAIVFDPSDADVMYYGTDGGVFKSTDGGGTFYGCNGGFVTTQFYSGLAISSLDSVVALGGLQDNGSLEFEGDPAWSKVYGGDGGWCAIDPTNDNNLFEEYVYLAISKSTDGGITWNGATGGLLTGSGNANFIAPFAISPTNPSILYAGATNVYKTTNGGGSWFAANGGGALNGTPLSCIAISPHNPDTVMAGTGSGSAGAVFQVYSTTNGGLSWTNVTGTLPNRFPTHFAFDPSQRSTVYMTCSGYGTSHLFRTTNLGVSWTDVSANLPDIPHQSVIVDPQEPTSLYVGTDLGVFYSSDAGGSWQDFNDGMPPAMVTDLEICNANSSLRAATFGSGVFQRYLIRLPSLSLASPNGGEILSSGTVTNITWTQKHVSLVKIEFSSDAGSHWTLVSDSVSASAGTYAWTVPAVSTSQGLVRISDDASGTPLDTSASVFTIVLNADVFAGWNLISVPRAVPDPRATSVFPTAISHPFAYASGYVQSDSLYPGAGYWLKFGLPQFCFFSGDSLFVDTVNVKKGWNLIGAISVPVSVGSLVQIPPANIASQFFGYSSGYFVADSLRPVKGYWVKVNVDGKLVLSSGHALDETIPDRSALTHLSSVNIADAGGNRQTLYLARAEDRLNPAVFEFPPTPPAGTFDTRFQSQRQIELLPSSGTGTYPLSVRSANGPVTISWSIHGVEGFDLVLDAKGQSIPMTAEGNITVASLGSLDVTVRATAVATPQFPRSITLSQNYPNPFNPSTVISYYLPQTDIVRLSIYNTVGQEVARIVEGVQQQGEHSVTFDGQGLSSGVYLCRLNAGAVTQIRKMLLLK